MNILVIGAGGREHAVAAACAKHHHHVFVSPGNPGMTDVAVVLGIDTKDREALLAAAEARSVDLVIIGPEDELTAGLSDQFSARGFSVFAPSEAAAQIEGSKSYAKELMFRYDIPTGYYDVFDNYDEAVAYVKQQGAPIVVKADGIAAGKGVTVAMTEAEAESALADVLLEGKFGASGTQVVLEEYLEGEELSVMALVNGQTVVPLAEAQDHKRAYDGDVGPNTGGMGAYSPVPQFDEADLAAVKKDVLQPAADALASEGRPFTGVLYAGLMMTADGPKVIEFNARFGDPETQVVLPRLASDLAQAVMELLNGETPKLTWHERAVLGVVLASVGYPGTYDKGVVLTGINFPEDIHAFWAGVAEEDGMFYTAGGRVLLAAAEAENLQAAQTKVYEALTPLQTPGLFYREDIGYKAIAAASAKREAEQ
ncbi:phosphoribosylamine--glycine ligase [Salsuginibacillus halophilus]|uniref:Phosphoribosylamine--glycine ligase n=1 Tax=Salsuginibacillus halophilus TaxID=517424 RepID=A0A2P8HLF2_9BACI|nr:phosphoribosylamine--glycine ligase [Salsuginibacillus halophilus]PSL47044.1 phosphoribosylamine--glycine ligase [Salsuginibacillus halophilus]